MDALSSYWTFAAVIIGLLAILPAKMGGFGLFGSNKFNVQGKTVLLTGASEGMGLSVAKQLAQKGANVMIVSRNVAKLEEALRQTKAAALSSTQKIQYISADISKPESSARVIAETIAWNDGLAPDVVWCIAGSSYPSLFLETPTAKMRQQMDVNYWSCVDMAHAILGEWLAPSATGRENTKHLIFTSSVVAFYPIVGYAPYAPAKAAIKSLSDTLVQEVLLYGDDVKIHTIFPGNIQSPGFENENQTKPAITHVLEESDPIQTPDAVAAKAIKGLEKGEYLITVGWLGAAMRACAWGGSKRNNWLVDTVVAFIASLVWFFVGLDLDGKVKAYGRQHGHPSTFAKK